MIKYVKILSFFVMILGAAAQSNAQTSGSKPLKMQWKVEGAVREALVYVPESAGTKSMPLVFVFHGHGGNMMNTYRRFGIHEQWQDAIVVYPQGLNTPGKLTDPDGKKSGWQGDAGNMDDRDLKFFDTMLGSLKKDFKVDERRIYATGHSNGGLFTYLLWAMRGDVFAALAPSGAAALKLTGLLKPKPVLHLMGEKDPLVKPALQKLTYNAVLRINQCKSGGKKTGEFTTLYKSESGNPVVLYIHPGGHELPDGAGKAIADFFKQNKK